MDFFAVHDFETNHLDPLGTLTPHQTYDGTKANALRHIRPKAWATQPSVPCEKGRDMVQLSWLL